MKSDHFGVGKEVRKNIGKCVTKVTKQDILESSGLLQVCAAHKSVREAAVLIPGRGNYCSGASGCVKRFQLTISIRRPS